MPVHKWSKTAASNATADSTINWQEGQAPSSVNDSSRAEMAAVAQWRDDISGVLTTGGTSSGYTLTTNSNFTSLSDLNGQELTFTPHTNNASPVTLNVDGLGAKALRQFTGVALQAGALIAGTPYTVTYSNANNEFLLRGSYGQTAVYGPKNAMDLMTAAQKADVFGRVGSVDVTAAVQAAIDSVSGGTVSMPPGVYLMDTINLKPSVTLEGFGQGSTIIKARSNSINSVQYLGSSNQFYFSVKGLTFDGNGKSGCTAIALKGSNASNRIIQVTLRDLYISAYDNGVWREFNANTVLDNVRTVATVRGFYQLTCADTDYLACNAQNGSGSGFYIESANVPAGEGTRLIGCSSNVQGRGLLVASADWGIVSGCSFTSASIAPAVVNAGSNWTFTGNDLSASNIGLQFDGTCTFNRVNANNFQLGTIGLSIGGQAHSVTGNTFWANTALDISIDASNTVVTGNLCLSPTTFSIAEQATRSGNVVVGNRVAGLAASNGTSGSLFANNQ